MNKFFWISLSLFILYIFVGLGVFYFVFGYCWGPSTQTQCELSQKLFFFLLPILFIPSAWWFFIKGERSRFGTRIHFLSITNLIIGIIITLIALYLLGGD